MSSRRILLAGCLVALVAAPAMAQSGAEAPEAKIHLGPLGLSPSLTIGNVGVDTNVFNTAGNQTRDFTVSFTPATTEEMTVGRLLLTGTTGVPLTYFQKANSQRSVGFQQKGRVDLDLIHFLPYASADYNSSYQRPNPEIDARVHQMGKTQMLGAIVRLGPRTSLDASYTDGTLRFDDSQFLGVDIAQQLDRRISALSATLKRSLTAITTLSIQSTLSHDRFNENPLLNTNSLSLSAGLGFRKDSRLSGTFTLGARALRPISPLVPKFTGVIGDVSLSWLARDTTRIAGVFNRNLDYSIDETTPYFIATAFSVSVTQLVIGRMDAVVGIGSGDLAYRGQVAVGPSLSRTDHTSTLSAGSGYRFRIDARLGFNMTYARRHSTLDNRDYSGFQFGGTMNYGF